MGVMGLARIASAWIAARLDLKSERGASAVEYGIMVAMIAAVVMLAVIFLGSETSRSFSCTAGSLSNSTNQC
jgi:pilus assembly protein Flp/PilA